MMERDVLLQWSAQIAKAGLDGRSETELVDLLCTNLRTYGFELETVEVACDVIDPERSDRFFIWREATATAEADSIALPLFEYVLENRLPMWRCRTDETASLAGAEIVQRVAGEGATDAIVFAHHIDPAAALGLFDDVMSFFVTHRPGGFTGAEVALLEGIMPAFALAFSARLNVSMTRTLLETYLGQDASAALLAGRSRLGDVGQIHAVVFYCDLLGFTGLTEHLSPDALIALLNRFFDAVTNPAARVGGQVSGHVGDAVVLFFPITIPEQTGMVCAAAVKAAVDALEALVLLNARRSPGMPELHGRIGIDIGEVVHGNIGSAGRFSFTIIGTPVNRAARLQALGKELGASLLMTADVAGKAGFDRRSFGFHTLRGSDQPVEVVGIT